MPNPIKYSTGTETLALKKGNVYIGTGDVGKGPSDTTGYYQGPSPTSGGYVIYLNKEGVPGGLSYHSAANDSELISFTNNLAGQSYTTVNECLVYFANQTDKVVLNRDYEGIVTDGLVLDLDAGFTPSYPKNGTTWYDVSGSNNGTLTNGPTFNSDNGGTIVFDGTNDFINLSYVPLTNNFSYNIWVLRTGAGRGIVISNGTTYIDVGFLNTILFSLWTGGQQNIIRSADGTMVPTGVWAMYSATYNKQQAKLYLNGVEMASANVSSDVTARENSFIMGDWNAGGFAPLNGKIPIAQLYNKALTSQEVLQNYNAQKGRFGL
jgi:hypothetical protein